ncbi:Gfo/Idh/MocA family protein [Boudabousia marimammalium]|uniref:Oxidoreductase n=1 Tax=Boudabousia marimammalium TaxID=156892 RepID=A0A1Q5PMJ9_9ACTO|nr:Gfo/Idh/MocA family oxidoreductase [Boudabousia marimammalium]OKL48670.1 hypothetical protein BM477_05585 [Boudabousia marimammalium]
MTANNVAPTLRVGVVGAGARSHLALKAETAANRGKIVAVVDPSPDTPRRMKLRLGREVPWYQTVPEMISAGVDVAFVTSPDDTHDTVTVQLLEAGIPVYLEKPLAITLTGANEILEAAYRSGTRLYVGHNMRHMNVVRQMRQIIQRGEIGEVKAIWCRHFVGSGGDFYFKDWHSQRRHVNGLLLQKAAHDIDVMHWLAGSYTEQVVGMGGLTVYNQVTARGGQGDKLMSEWHSLDNWPPLSQTGLADVIDVEDLSMMLLRLESGVFASYEQCHYSPDYWRNYTVIGTEGRLENFGDSEGGVIRVWNQRTYYNPDGDRQYPIVGDAQGHNDADQLTVDEFIRFVRYGDSTDTSPLGAWHAVAAGIAATDSLRQGSTPRHISAPPAKLRKYFESNQQRIS